MGGGANRAYTWGIRTILIVHLGLVAWSGSRHSPCIDEVGHFAAGLDHWEFGRFHLYRVNPPLVRLVACMPLYLAGIEASDLVWSPRPTVRPEFDLGRDLVRIHGEKSFEYIAAARWACLPFTALGLWVASAWARDLFGHPAGLLAAGLWASCPMILGHAALITPDVGATATGLLAGYLFRNWVQQPGLAAAGRAGIGLGLALSCKFTWVILLPLWPALWLAIHAHSTRWLTGAAWCRQGRDLAVAVAVAVLMVNAIYLFEATLTPLGRLTFVSQRFSGREDAQPGNRFADTPIGHLPVPLPENVVMGIDVQTRDFEVGMVSYLRGELRQGGWWYYYLYALWVKWPHGIWALLLLAFVATIRFPGIGPRWDEYLLLAAPAIAVLLLVSSHTGFNHHMRYVLPALPFAYIGVGRTLAEFDRAARWWKALTVTAIVATVASSLAVYPHSMSYFNEGAGGPAHGSDHLIDSNIDWGQDLIYLKEWLAEHPEARPLGLAFRGGFDPRDVGVEYTLPPPSLSTAALLSPLPLVSGPTPGWYAVSVSHLRGIHGPIGDGRGGWIYNCQPRYVYFRQFRPIGRAGYSILIYHLTAEDCARVRAESPLAREAD